MSNKPNTFYISFQILFWVGYAILFLLSINNILSVKQSVLLLCINIISQLALSIFNNSYLLPNLFDTRKYSYYFLSIFICIISVVVIRYYIGSTIVLGNVPFPNLNKTKYFVLVLATTFIIFLITTGFYFFKQWFVERQKQDEIIQQQLATELKLLKAQINPHFLFNALNNVYSLTQIEPEKAGEMVLKLSDVLRYMLYDSEKDKIYIEKEVSNIYSLIDLHQIQYDNKANIDFVVSGNVSENLIHPMLLFPFFENAFKHGNLFQQNTSFLKSNLEITNNQLHFYIENSFVEDSSKDKIGGLGIDNTQKRLELFYPNQHQFSITKEKNIFKVDLKINIVS